MNYAKTLKLRFRVGELHLPERIKRYTSSSREDEDAQMCPCGKAVHSLTHIMEECDIRIQRGTECVREDAENRRMCHGEVEYAR